MKRNWYQTIDGETEGMIGQVQGEKNLLLSIHGILTPSLLCWVVTGQLVPLLQSPSWAFSSFGSCSFLKNYHCRTQTILLNSHLAALRMIRIMNPQGGLISFSSLYLFSFSLICPSQNTHPGPLYIILWLFHISFWYPHPYHPTSIHSHGTFPSRSCLPSCKDLWY